MKYRSLILIALLIIITIFHIDRLLAQRSTPNTIKTPTISPPSQFGKVGQAAGEFKDPQAIAMNNQQIYIADTFNHRIQVLDLTGKVINAWGRFGNQNGELKYPKGIAIDNDGSIYVADSGNQRIQVFTSTGKFLRQLGSSEKLKEALGTPTALTVQHSRVYICDPDHERIVIFNTAGEFLQTIGHYGKQAGEFNQPSGIVVDEEDAIYVSDSNNHRIEKFNRQGEFLQSWGTYGQFPEQFSHPTAIVYKRERLYIADRDNHRIQIFDRKGRLLSYFGNHELTNSTGKFHFPNIMAINDHGDLIVGESAISRFQIFAPSSYSVTEETTAMDRLRPINPWHGERAIVAGNYLAANFPDQSMIGIFNIMDQSQPPKLVAKISGWGAKFGQLNNPQGLVIDTNRGILYVSDTANHRIEIFEMSILTSDEAGSAFVQAFGRYGSGRGEFRQPQGLALDGQGNLYVCDSLNRRIVVFDPQHIILREWAIDEAKTAAKPIAIAIDQVNQRIYLLMDQPPLLQSYDLTGKAIADWHTELNDQLSTVSDLLLGKDGTIYLCDAINKKIYRLDKLGKLISKWEMNEPFQAMAENNQKNIYLLDSINHRLQLYNNQGKYLNSWEWSKINRR